MLCAAGGEYSLVGGKWLDGVSSPEPGCKPCPSKDATVVVCEGNAVRSQPGYYSYFIEEQSRRTGPYVALAFAQCPNLRACKNVGDVNSTCTEDSLSACNSVTGGKCAEGYTGTNTHTHQACCFISCEGFLGVLCAQCAGDWFASRMVGSFVCRMSISS